MTAITIAAITITVNMSESARQSRLYEGKGIIRVHSLVRNNASVDIDNTVAVRKFKADPAEKVIAAPLGAMPLIDERYLAGVLESVPLIK